MSASRNRRRIAVITVTAGLLAIPAIALAGSTFSDVADGSTHAAGIEYVAETGITQGCTADEYCPDDPLTRAQMGTFIHRLSGNDPATPPNVNAAELDGHGPSAYTTTMTSVSLPENTTIDLAESEVLQLSDLSPGQYLITGQVVLSGPSTDTAVAQCRLRLGDDFVGQSMSRIGTDPGFVALSTMPMTAHVTITGSATDVTMLCGALLITGADPVVIGESDRTQLIAMRIGDGG